MKGEAGPIRRDDASATPFDTQISVARLDPVASGFFDPQAGVGFVGAIEISAASNGQALTAEGTARLENLKLRKGAKPSPKPVDFAFKVTHQLKSNSGEIEDASVKLGDTAVHASGSYQPSDEGIDVPLLNLKLTGQNLPINDLQNLMTAAAVRLPNGSMLKGGTLGLNLTIHGLSKALAISGPIAFENTKLEGFDVGSKIHGIAALGGMETGDTTDFEHLRMHLHMANSGVTAEQIDAIVGGVGTLTGAGTVSPTDQLDFNLLLTGANAKGIGKVGIGLISVLKGGGGGKSGVPIHVGGTSEEPYITADVGSIFGGGKKKK
jgi:AsmA protein